jgi:cob(I)alamin adenosyltransferase
MTHQEAPGEGGLIHVYLGDGKGKTTAAVGLLVRAAGRGKKTLLVQFLKSDETGELVSLEKLGVRVIRSSRRFGFTFRMGETEQADCRAEQERLLQEAGKAAQDGGYEVLAFDEVLDALNAGMVDPATFRSLVERRNPAQEWIITGRNPPSWLTGLAGYITEMKKVKHPFDAGIAARIGIEQ